MQHVPSSLPYLASSVALLSYPATISCARPQSQSACLPPPPARIPPAKSRTPSLKDAQDKIFETLANMNHQKNLITPQVGQRALSKPRG